MKANSASTQAERNHTLNEKELFSERKEGLSKKVTLTPLPIAFGNHVCQIFPCGQKISEFSELFQYLV